MGKYMNKWKDIVQFKFYLNITIECPLFAKNEMLMFLLEHFGTSGKGNKKSGPIYPIFTIHTTK